jgi:hypothetical protein
LENGIIFSRFQKENVCIFEKRIV